MLIGPYWSVCLTLYIMHKNIYTSMSIFQLTVHDQFASQILYFHIAYKISYAGYKSL